MSDKKETIEGLTIDTAHRDELIEESKKIISLIRNSINELKSDDLFDILFAFMILKTINNTFQGIFASIKLGMKTGLAMKSPNFKSDNPIADEWTKDDELLSHPLFTEPETIPSPIELMEMIASKIKGSLQEEKENEHKTDIH